MKKTVILKALLILFPIMAVGLATTVDSVMVYDPIAQQTTYYSYFEALPVNNLQMITPLAALAAALSGIMAAAYMAKKHNYLVKAAGYAAIASSCLASVPMMVREDIFVVPNVALPIFMVLEYVVSFMLQKDEQKAMEKAHKKKLKNKKR